MPCVHDNLYYKLMEVNKHHHYEDLKKSLEEGEELTEDNILEESQDLESSEESIDDLDFIFDMSKLKGIK